MISIWFFYKKKQTIYLPVSRVVQGTIKNHLGTLTFWTLIKLSLGLVLSIFNFVFKKLKKIEKTSIGKILQMFLMPLFCLYFNIFRYLRKDFFIQNYLWNDNLWTSSKKAYFLIKSRNSHRTEGPEKLYNFTLKQLKISVCMLINSLFLLLNSLASKTILGFTTDEIQYIYIPCLFMFMVNYYICSLFFDSFEFVNKTVVHCYYLDEEMFIGG